MKVRAFLRLFLGLLGLLLAVALGVAGQILPRIQALSDEQLLVNRVAEEAGSLLVRLPVLPETSGLAEGQREQIRRLAGLLTGAEREFAERRRELRNVTLAQARLQAAMDWSASPAGSPAADAARDAPAGPLLRLSAETLLVEVQDWRAAVAADREHLLWNGIFWLAGLLAAGLGLAGLGAWLVHARVLRPLDRLRGQVQAIEQGRIDSRIEAEGAPEIRQLAGRMSGMRDVLLYSNRRLEGMNRNLQEEIRQRQSAEAALRDNNRDLENRVTRRTEDLARYATLLERRNLDLRRFTRVASHDMRTPLRAIASFNDILRSHLDSRLDEQSRDWFARVERNTARLETLVDDLLSYSQFDSRELHWGRLEMDKVLDESLSLLGETVQASDVTIDVQKNLPVVEADRTAMVNVLMNLIGNAVKFRSDSAPYIAVRGERRESETVFSVEDNGIGIAAAFREQVFEPFKRLHTQHDIPGTGLGLAICRRILERHGGHIWVESGDGQGSRFCFVIPDRKPLHGG